jgi:hypothetical protein
MDELKKYFHQYRDELDTDVPGEDNWQQIRRQLHPVVPVKSLRLFKWMVAASLVILAGSVVYLLTNNKKQSPVITNTDTAHRHQAHPEIVHPKTPVEKIIIAEKQQPVIAQQKTTPVKGTRRKRISVKKMPIPVYGFEDIEASYTSMVNQQLERVRTQPIYAEDAEYFHSFKKQFTELAKDEEQLKQRIRQTGMADEYVDELINIYQEKIGVLKRLRFEINKMNNRVRQADPGIQQQQPAYINL